ncbi:hypothetical protein [Bartonella sp. AA74HLJMH]|uniref:hypothetical protein n=1 Tax=Bartonella sp. AA74HLJMH TaxID=3243436 RepID=UPI0035D06113
MRAMTEVDLGLRFILAACLGFQYGGTTLGKGNCSISQEAYSLLATLGALVLRADVNIWQLSHKSFMEDESLGFEKNIEKIYLGRFC